jgi:hypothetical protein
MREKALTALVARPPWPCVHGLEARATVSTDFLCASPAFKSTTSGKRHLNILALISCLVMAGAAQAGWQQSAKLTVSDELVGFGESVAIRPNYAVVGAPWFDRRTGCAYVFKRYETQWILHAKLTASDGAYNDKFGSSVAIDGDYVIVGAPGHGDLDGGAAYVFNRDGKTWIHQAKLGVPYAGAGAAVGWSVSIDGDYALVGAPGHDNHRGAAFLFRCKDTEWLNECRLDPSHEYRACDFGWSVSICGDYAMVGTSSPYSEPGCAYIFRRGEKTWTQQIKLTAPEAASGDKFGQSVSIDRYYAAAGAAWLTDWPGRVYIFQREGMKWIQQAKLSGSTAGKEMDSFGCSVCIGADCAIVGAQEAGKRGEAYIFRRSDRGWAEQVKLITQDGQTPYGFGSAVAICQDYAIVGGTKTESAYVFEMSK